MKRMFFIFLIIPIPSFAQNLRCLTAHSYSMIKNGGALIKVNKPISVCFNDYYFSFYTPLTGTRTFRITNNSIDTLKFGYTRQRFMNDESETNMKGDYNIEIDYEKKKTVVIGFAKFGEAYIVQVPGFAGSVEQDESKYKVIKKSISERIKEDTAFNPNYQFNPQLRKLTAKTHIDINTYISKEIKWVGGRGDVDMYIIIDKDGSPKGRIIGSSLPAQKDKDAISKEIITAFERMPKWSIPYNVDGLPIKEHATLHISLIE